MKIFVDIYNYRWLHAIQISSSFSPTPLAICSIAFCSCFEYLSKCPGYRFEWSLELYSVQVLIKSQVQGWSKRLELLWWTVLYCVANILQVRPKNVGVKPGFSGCSWSKCIFHIKNSLIERSSDGIIFRTWSSKYWIFAVDHNYVFDNEVRNLKFTWQFAVKYGKMGMQKLILSHGS